METVNKYGAVEASKVIRVSLLSHIWNRIKKLEKLVNGVVALQFADHPQGLSMVLRVYTPQSEKEYSYPDCILPFELVERDLECSRVDVLFDTLEKALNSIQVVSSTNNGLIHHS